MVTLKCIAVLEFKFSEYSIWKITESVEPCPQYVSNHFQLQLWSAQQKPLSPSDKGQNQCL